jgi:cell volume regulation protein A
MPDASRLYAIVFVVVAFSVLVQGGTLPVLAARLRVVGCRSRDLVR